MSFWPTGPSSERSFSGLDTLTLTLYVRVRARQAVQGRGSGEGDGENRPGPPSLRGVGASFARFAIRRRLPAVRRKGRRARRLDHADSVDRLVPPRDTELPPDLGGLRQRPDGNGARARGVRGQA